MPDQAAADAPEEVQPPASLDEALLAFQSDPPQLIKDAEADVKNAQGAKLYSYKYLTLQKLLEELRPRLTELGLLWKTKPGINEAGKATLIFSMKHVPSGEEDAGEMPLVTGNSMQQYGGALSFARRYALLTVLGLAPDVDEDGAPVEQTAAGAKKIGKQKATKLVEAAEAAGLMERLQLAASHVYEADVGDCSTKAKAITAMQKLSTAQAERLFNKIAELDATAQAAAQEQG